MNELVKTLRRNKNFFAWKVTDILGINPNVISHKLSLCRKAKSISQKRRRMGEEKKRTTFQETEKLLQVGFIRQIQYTTWLTNVVLVKKLSEKWIMCTDYTNLNKACSKDSYPLHSIDRLVNGASGQAMMSFLGAYSGYNQIQMYESDVPKTTFTTEVVNCCYKVMPFRLKNAGATY